MSRFTEQVPGVDSEGEASLKTRPLVPESAGIPRIELHVEREAGKPSTKTIILEGDRFLVGSHPRNDLVLDDPLVSRFHLQLSRGVRGWAVTDMGSLNGTRVAGITVRDADLSLPECRIDVGESVIRVRELAQSPVGETVLPGAVRFGAMYGSSARMRRLFDVIRRAAPTDSNVLIEGESGTGKELVAKEIVRISKRADKPFVIIDCGAISPTVIESELFGHVRGAFTGADRNRVGAFEEANGGTVFLDEIGELPLEMQPKLLRALSTREMRRMGENQLRKVDVRVIAATNRTLEREVNQGRFREDLYFRLSVVTLRVPPLRERIDDLPLLVSAILDSLNAGEKAQLFTPEVFEEMAHAEWPGNVRELRNYVERRVVLGAPQLAPEEGEDRPSMLPSSSATPQVDIHTPFKAAKEHLVSGFERAYLKALLAWSDGNISRAARKAEIDRMYLHRLLQNYGLRRGGPLID